MGEGRIESLEQAAGFLESLINVERLPDRRHARLGLGPVRSLLERVGRPERGLRVLHVAGSKGKGSTVLYAEALLRRLGLRTGAFVSPHLERWTERFRLDGQEVEGARLAAAVERLRPHVQELRASRSGDAPSFFDATTAAALLLFAEASVDCALLEVGLGGRLDSTNVVEPTVCCVTSIELEHTEKLGNTLAEIAGEKAGILKPGVPTVMGRLPAPAAAVVEARARELGCPLARLGHEVRVEGEASEGGGLRLRYAEPGLEVDASLSGLARHQLDNAGLALAAVRRLGLAGDAALAEAARRALPGVRLPARVEVLGRRPWCVVDAAHTPDSARALALALAALPYRQGHLVLSVSRDKDLAAVVAPLAPRFHHATLTRADPHRSLDPRQVAEALRAAKPELELRVVPNPQLAVRAARAAVGPEDLVCAAGSTYLAGIARALLSRPDRSDDVVVSRRAPGRTPSADGR